MGRPPLKALAIVVVLCLIPGGVFVHGDDVLLQIDDAFVTNSDGTWTIGNEMVRYSLARDGNTIGVRAIADPLSDRDWHRSNGPDSFVVVNSQKIDIGSPTTPFVEATTSEHWGGVRLDMKYRLPAADLDLIRSYVVYPGSSVVETWTSFTETGRQTIALSDLTNYAFKVENGKLRWVTGLNTKDENGGPFTLNEDDIDDGQTFEIGSNGRASEDNVPWFSMQVEEAQFFGSILWGGSWRLKMQRSGDQVALQMGLPSFATSLGAGGTLETPHAIFGLTNAFLPETSLALKNFIEKGVRHGRPFGSYVSYNTWYSYGTQLNEESMRAEMETAAAIGVEQFVIDAGWWAGYNPDDRGDFVHNWGNWQVDPDRFPNGLGALSDRAHELGMRFGVWIEPERVALATVGQDGLARERFLAMRDGRYDPGVANRDAESAQVCLADDEAREWVTSKVLGFIDEVRPDYIKWDNNFWVNCNRASHSHGSQDGNFKHMRGLQSVLDRIREAYPNLEIENCSGGGNRLSLDMLAFSDSAWLDDRTYPALRVRHVTEGLLGIFPSPYLLTFALAMAESIDEGRMDDASYVLRSRMSGQLGLSLVLADLDEGARADASRQIALYKQIRPIMQDSSAFLLSKQATAYADQGWSGWDVIEHVSRRTGEAVILAFDSVDGPTSVTVYPKALRTDAIYDVESADYGVLGSSSGPELMAQGIEVLTSSISRGHVMILRPRAKE